MRKGRAKLLNLSYVFKPASMVIFLFILVPLTFCQLDLHNNNYYAICNFLIYD